MRSGRGCARRRTSCGRPAQSSDDEEEDDEEEKGGATPLPRADPEEVWRLYHQIYPGSRREMPPQIPYVTSVDNGGEWTKEFEAGVDRRRYGFHSSVKSQAGMLWLT